MKNLYVAFLLMAISTAGWANGKIAYQGASFARKDCGRAAAVAVFNVIRDTMSSAVSTGQIRIYLVSEAVPGLLYSVRAVDASSDSVVVDAQAETSVLSNGSCEAAAYRILPSGSWTTIWPAAN